MPLQLVSPPSEEPVTLEDMAQHVRQDNVDEDDYLESLISAARELIEQATGRAFCDQTWKLTLRDFPCSGFIRLPKSPLLEVVSVTYRDTDGNYQTLQENVDYYVDLGSEPGMIDPGNGSWRVTGNYPDGVAIVFRAGYIDATGSPPLTVLCPDVPSSPSSSSPRGGMSSASR